MQDSIFTQIIKGEIPSHKVYEDDMSLAIVDIYPVQPGQVVIFPKRQVPFVWDLETAEYAALMATVQRVGQRLRQLYPEKARIGIMVEGLEVDNHAHVKVFPFSNGAEYHNHPNTEAPVDHAALAAFAERFRAA